MKITTLDAVPSNFSLLPWLRVRSFVVTGYSYFEIFAEGFRDKIFDTEMVAALGRALRDEDYDTRSSAVEIIIAAIAQGAPPSFARDVQPEIFAEGVRDKIFITEIIAALRRALTDRIDDLTVRFFTAAIAQGSLRCFHSISILNICRGCSRRDIQH